MKTRTFFLQAAIAVFLIVSAYTSEAQTSPDEVKGRALQILSSKCNVCHRTQNPGKVFSTANMNGYAEKIYKQVFIKQRMPRGNEIKLTESDKKTLLTWLKTQVAILSSNTY